MLARNLAALEIANPGLSAVLIATAPRTDIEFHQTDEPGGAVSASIIGNDGAQRLMASKRRPMSEARTLVSGVDPSEAAVCVVSGFGLGHHVQALVEKIGEHGLIVVFEPDLGLLRRVLETIDHSAWLARSGVRVLVDAADAAAMMTAVKGSEGLVGMGVKLIEHPASVQRLGPAAGEFARTFVSVVDAVRMTVMTTLVQVRITFRNFLQNIDRYVTTPGVGDLRGVCAGKPAVVVSAGPSLERNIALLAEPGVRERCVIVAAQTVLKPLLKRGIRPHFVTALDYSEVSARFYEGLTAADVEGVTLVAEAKVNPSVLAAWPGALRVLPDRVLDQIVGEDVKNDASYLAMGATVAHLAYTLARHLGCDPVLLVGQDLGFTDGQYYAAGAAIHDTWAGELNSFNTLEMLEHQRIMRMGSHLRKLTDVFGRPIYTDEQMLNYLRGFEEAFRDDARRGLTTLDVTEGGVKKAHAEATTLSEALLGLGVLGEVVNCRGASVPATFVPRADAPKSDRLKSLEKRLIEVQRQTTRLAELSTTTAGLLSELIEHQHDLQRADRIISKLDGLAAAAVGLQPGFTLVQQLGQTMVFNRLRADRLIGIESELSPMERQRRQAERDVENVRSTALTARTLGSLLAGALDMLRTGKRQSGDISAQSILSEQAAAARGEAHAPKPQAARPAVACVIPVDLEMSGVGRLRRLDVPIGGFSSILAATVERARRIRGVSAVVLLTSDETACRGLLSGVDMSENAGAAPIVFERASIAELRARSVGVGRARAWSGACYRGGILNLTCFDEAYEPVGFQRALRKAKAAAGLIVGADWCALDQDLCAQLIDRYADEPSRNRLTFSQAAPGLAGCVLSADLNEALASSSDRTRAVTSIGGLMAYRPEAPSVDILGQRMCVAVRSELRDAGVRLIAEDEVGRRRVERMLAGEAAAAIRDAHAEPSEVEIDLRGQSDAGAMTSLCRRIGDDARRSCSCIAVTLQLKGAGASMTHELVRAIGAGIPVHVRVPMTDIGACREWTAWGIDVLSVDVDPLDDAGRTKLDALMVDLQKAAAGDDFSMPWLVPRITRCDASYPFIESVVERGIVGAGWCVIDPADGAHAEDRIRPLPQPASARARRSREVRVVRLGESRP